MDERGKALSDVTSTPNFGLVSSGTGSGDGMISPIKWAQTPPVRGSTAFTPRSSLLSGTEMSPQLFMSGTGVGMTPFSEMFTHPFYPSPGLDPGLNPGTFFNGGSQLPAQAPQNVRKSAIRDEFQRWTIDERAAKGNEIFESPHMGCPPNVDTPVSSAGSKLTLSPPTAAPPHIHLLPMQRQRMVPVDYPMQPQQYMQQNMGMPMCQMPRPQPQYDVRMLQPKQEPMYQREMAPSSVGQFVPYPNEYYPQNPAMMRMGHEASPMGEKGTATRQKTTPSSRLIAKKEESEGRNTDSEIVDKRLLKQIRSRDAASRQRNRQKTYLSKLEDDNAKLRRRVETLVKHNESLRLDIRLRVGPQKGGEVVN